MKGALGGGAMALLAGLALQALQGRSTAMPGAGGGIPLGLRTEERELEANAELVMKAMISAAKADAEMDKIVGRLQESGTDSGLQRLVMEEIRGPLDFEGLVARVPNRQVAAEVYAASLLAIEVDTAAEKAYLARLARALGLQPEVVQRLHASLGVG